MRDITPFNWHASSGWIVLSGSADALSEVRARALSRCDASGAIAYISFAGDMGDALMDDMAELGATSGYLVDLDEHDSNEIYERLSGAAMIVVEADVPSDGLARLLRQTAIHAMKDALNRGGLILLEAAAAATAGDYLVESSTKISAGLGLVQNTLVAAEPHDTVDNESLRSLRLQMPDTTFIGLAPGSALVLGPEGAIETWGERQVSISLGNLAGASVDIERDWAIE